MASHPDSSPTQPQTLIEAAAHLHGGGVLGELLVVRTFEQASLALVTRAELPMSTGDRLGAPFDD